MLIIQVKESLPINVPRVKIARKESRAVKMERHLMAAMTGHDVNQDHLVDIDANYVQLTNLKKWSVMP